MRVRPSVFGVQHIVVRSDMLCRARLVQRGVEVFFTSSGEGTDVATEVLWDESGREWVTPGSAETDAVATSAGSSDGVRKVLFKGSASSGEETRKLESVGDSSLVLL
jgi:hypothetical protein